MREDSVIPDVFFKSCAFVSVDFQEGGPPKPVTDNRLPELWKSKGFKAEDVNAANEYAWKAARPNAMRVAEACRHFGMSMIFVHWGCLFEDGMDVDPEIREMQIEEHGSGSSDWIPHIAKPECRPAGFFHIQKGDYVIAKTGQDSFTSSNLGFVLRNLRIERIILIGGHTGACLGRTSKSAKSRGYQTLCVHDATFDARESARIPNIEECGYDFIVSTVRLISLLDAIQGC